MARMSLAKKLASASPSRGPPVSRELMCATDERMVDWASSRCVMPLWAGSPSPATTRSHPPMMCSDGIASGAFASSGEDCRAKPDASS
eukprot:3372172-Pleurochrysis_carterae.AAC.2